MIRSTRPWVVDQEFQAQDVFQDSLPMPRTSANRGRVDLIDQDGRDARPRAARLRRIRPSIISTAAADGEDAKHHAADAPIRT